MFKQILFPVDFSSSAERVVPYVRSVAQKYGSTIHVVHVVADLTGELYAPGESIVTFISEIRENAETMMGEYCDKNFSGMANVFAHIMEGDPAEEIVRFARENGDSLIIMGTHGRKGLDRVVFGSVAENVLRTSPVPVLTVNPHLVAVEA
jgi:nucleotide-binding universal stress UspA family protein